MGFSQKLSRDSFSADQFVRIISTHTFQPPPLSEGKKHSPEKHLNK